MRDPARIRRILGKLERYWSSHPLQDMRLGQLIFSLSFLARGPDADPFHVEDDVIEEYLDSKLEEMVEITFDLSDEDFMTLAKMAHERDITFNQMVAEILELEIKRLIPSR